MPIKVNGTTLTGLNVGGTKITKVQVRQNASSPYVTVYEAVTKTKKVRIVNPDDLMGFGDDIAAWGYMTANTKTDIEWHFSYSNISGILFDCDTMQANYNNMETDYKSLVENFNNTPTSDFPIDLTNFSGAVWCTNKGYRQLSYAPGTKHVFYGNLYDFILGRTNLLYGVPSEQVLQADIPHNPGNYVHLITGSPNNAAFNVGDELIENCVEVDSYNRNGKQIIMLYNVSTNISAVNRVDAYITEIADKLNQRGLTSVAAVHNEETLDAIQSGVFENYQIVIFNAGRLETKFGGPGFREFMTSGNGLNWSQNYSKWIIYNDYNNTEVATFVNDALTLSYITPFFSVKIIDHLYALTNDHANDKMLITNVELSDFAKMNIDRINNFRVQVFGAKSSLWKTCLRAEGVPNNFANVVDAALLTSDLGYKVNHITSSYFPKIVVGYEE